VANNEKKPSAKITPNGMDKLGCMNNKTAVEIMQQ
jgi:hypothetical protein